jgi:hypothetical protein
MAEINFSFFIQQSERFLKNSLFLQARWVPNPVRDRKEEYIYEGF